MFLDETHFHTRRVIGQRIFVRRPRDQNRHHVKYTAKKVANPEKVSAFAMFSAKGTAPLRWLDRNQTMNRFR